MQIVSKTHFACGEFWLFQSLVMTAICHFEPLAKKLFFKIARHFASLNMANLGFCVNFTFLLCKTLSTRERLYYALREFLGCFGVRKACNGCV